VRTKQLNVLVLEKGGYYDREEFTQWTESEAMARAYGKGGLCTSEDGNIVVLAGSTVGGGSTINWSASFRTPRYVLDDWVASGLDVFRWVCALVHAIGQLYFTFFGEMACMYRRENGEFERSLDAAHVLLKVNTECSHRTASEEKALCEKVVPPFRVNSNNQRLWESASKLGFQPEKIPRNVADCVDCGHCCFGCPHGSKQSTAVLMGSLIEDVTIPRGQLRILPNCRVDRILTERWLP